MVRDQIGPFGEERGIVINETWNTIDSYCGLTDVSGAGHSACDRTTIPKNERAQPVRVNRREAGKQQERMSKQHVCVTHDSS